MPQDNAAAMHRWFEEIWNNGRDGAIDELFAEDGVMCGLAETGVEVRGPAEFRPFVDKLRGAFPDIHVTVEQTVSEGDWVAARWTVRMTHEGDGQARRGRRHVDRALPGRQAGRGMEQLGRDGHAAADRRAAGTGRCATARIVDRMNGMDMTPGLPGSSSRGAEEVGTARRRIGERRRADDAGGRSRRAGALPR
jgi:hypothetical protein